MAEIWDGFMENKALLVVAILLIIDIGIFIFRFIFGIVSFRRSSKAYAAELLQSEQRMKDVIEELNNKHVGFVDQITKIKESIARGETE